MDEKKIQLLGQLIDALGDSSTALENSYLKKDIEKFNKSKEEILKIQKRIADIVK